MSFYLLTSLYVIRRTVDAVSHASENAKNRLRFAARHRAIRTEDDFSSHFHARPNVPAFIAKASVTVYLFSGLGSPVGLANTGSILVSRFIGDEQIGQVGSSSNEKLSLIQPLQSSFSQLHTAVLSFTSSSSCFLRKYMLDASPLSDRGRSRSRILRVLKK